MYNLFLVFFLFISISLVTVVMLQKNRNSDMGSSFSSSTSMSLFRVGSGDVLTKITCFLAIFFFFLSLILGNLSNEKNIKSKTHWENLNEIKGIKNLKKTRGEFK